MDEANSISYELLKLFSHSRNRLTEEEIAARVLEQPYDVAKTRKRLTFFSKYLDFRGKYVIDVGCGYGDLLIGLAKNGIARGFGVDVDPMRIGCARKNAEAEGVADRLRFECIDIKDYDLPDRFDLALSLNSFEHVQDPSVCLRKIYDVLKPGGTLTAHFGPLWWSPHGAHMFGFTNLPWVNVFFPEKVVLRVRRDCYRPGQDVERYEDIVGHLNRMTVSRFKRYALDAGFDIDLFRVNPEKDWKWGGILHPLNSLLNVLPGIREVGALMLLAILKRPE